MTLRLVGADGIPRVAAKGVEGYAADIEVNAARIDDPHTRAEAWNRVMLALTAVYHKFGKTAANGLMDRYQLGKQDFKAFK